MNVALADRTAYQYVHIMYLASSVFVILAKFGLIHDEKYFKTCQGVYTESVHIFHSSKFCNISTACVEYQGSLLPEECIIEAYLQTSCVTTCINILRTDLNFSTLSSTLILYTTCTPYTYEWQDNTFVLEELVMVINSKH